MPAPSTPDATRSRGWQIGLAVVLVATLAAMSRAVVELVTLWVTKADYSHGLAVVPFVAYLLWTRRDQFPDTIRWPDAWGVPFFLAGGALYVAAERVNIAREFSQGTALLLCLAGAVVMFCGRWKGLAWAWPGFAFMPLTFLLPHFVEHKVSLQLQKVATNGSNFVFQTLGVMSYTEGNVINIGSTKLEVAKACNGLTMLLTFVALTLALVFLSRSRPPIDKALVLASAIPIALFCNAIRIVVTGLIYNAGWTEIGNAAVHDFAGWAMMPVALGLLWAELKVIDWVVEPADRLSTGDALGLPKKRRSSGPDLPPFLPGPAR